MREQTSPVTKMRRLHRCPNGPIDINPEEDTFIGLDHLQSRSGLEELRQRREELTATVLSMQNDGQGREIASVALALTEQPKRDAREREASIKRRRQGRHGELEIGSYNDSY